jgi:hypothetical protein
VAVIKLYDLARMTTATATSGTIALGSAVSGFLTFAGAGVSNGETVRYAIRDGANSEVGTGVYTSAGTTLTRGPIKSTNGNAAITLSGTAEVAIVGAAEDFRQIYIDNGAVGTPSLTFDSDPDSGIYRIGANNIGVAANGAKVLDIATTGLTVVGDLLWDGAGFSTWSPTITFNVGSGTPVVNAARYKRFGKLIVASVYLTFSGLSGVDYAKIPLPVNATGVIPMACYAMLSGRYPCGCTLNYYVGVGEANLMGQNGASLSVDGGYNITMIYETA